MRGSGKHFRPESGKHVDHQITSLNAWHDAKYLYEIVKCVNGSASFAKIYQDCLELDQQDAEKDSLHSKSAER